MTKRHAVFAICAIMIALILLAGGAFYWYHQRNSVAKAWGLAAEASQHQQNGQLLEARIKMRRAIAIQDDVVDFHLNLGRFSFEATDLPAAFASYDTALALAPANREALLAVSQIGLQIGEITKAREAARILLLQNSQMPEALLVNGVIDLMDRDYEAALRAADAVLASEPAREEAIALKIRATYLDGDESEALGLAETLAAPRKDSAPLALTELELYRVTAKPDLMLDAFAKLRNLSVENAELVVDEAAVHFKLGNATKAKDLILTMLVKEKLPGVQVNDLIRVLRLYSPIAITAADKLRVRRQGTKDARIEFAKFLIYQGDVEGGLAMSEGMQDAAARSINGLVLVQEGKIADALTLSEKIIAFDETNCFGRYLQSVAEAQSGRLRNSVYSAQRATDECPDLVDAWVAMAKSYDSLGRPQQANRVFQQAMDSNPQDPELVTVFEQWALSEGRAREALAARRKLARNMPSYTPAWEKYFRLCQALSAPCIERARDGLDESRTLYGIDTPPGARANNGLFGRFLIR